MKRKATTPPHAPQLPWPRLSEDLTCPRHPNHCQSCGVEIDTSDGIAGARWREHDDTDKPDPIVVVLCRACSGRLIKPHPRLYERLDPNAPWPGCMALCVTCRHRDGVRCTHPDLTSNGGTGLLLTLPKSIPVHVNLGGGRGYWTLYYPHPPRACAGRQTTEHHTGSRTP